MSVVALVRGDSPIDMVLNALERIGAEQIFSVHDQVLVKPNYINDMHPSTGVTTDARVIEGVVKFLKEQGIENVIVGEGSGFADTFQAFRVAGIDKVAERWNAKLVDLNKDPLIRVEVPTPLTLKQVNVAKTALESRLVSVPKLKLHRTAGVTLSLKNMIGAVSPKGSVHSRLGEKIADLASILRPSLSVIDGIIAGEGHETSGDPVEMNLVLAGTDPVAVDAVGAAVMGLNPRGIRHLRLAEEKGLGTCDLNQIKIVGEPIERVQRKFVKSPLSGLLTRLNI